MKKLYLVILLLLLCIPFLSCGDTAEQKAAKRKMDESTIFESYMVPTSRSAGDPYVYIIKDKMTGVEYVAVEASNGLAISITPRLH